MIGNSFWIATFILFAGLIIMAIWQHRKVKLNDEIDRSILSILILLLLIEASLSYFINIFPVGYLEKVILAIFLLTISMINIAVVYMKMQVKEVMSSESVRYIEMKNEMNNSLKTMDYYIKTGRYNELKITTED